MAMISMKREPEEGGESGMECCAPYPKDVYPICIYLNTEEIDKLGIGDKAVGSEVTMTFKMIVNSSGARQVVEDGETKTTRNMELSVTDAEVVGQPARSDNAKVLFGSE